MIIRQFETCKSEIWEEVTTCSGFCWPVLSPCKVPATMPFPPSCHPGLPPNFALILYWQPPVAYGPIGCRPKEKKVSPGYKKKKRWENSLLCNFLLCTQNSTKKKEKLLFHFSLCWQVLMVTWQWSQNFLLSLSQANIGTSPDYCLFLLFFWQVPQKQNREVSTFLSLAKSSLWWDKE